MRDETLKRLDELVESIIAKHEDEYDYADSRAAWAALRADLAAEKCENCAGWIKDGPWTCISKSIATGPNYCCAFYTPREKL